MVVVCGCVNKNSLLLTHALTHVCTYTCVHLRMCALTHVCTYTCVHLHMCALVMNMPRCTYILNSWNYLVMYTSHWAHILNCLKGYSVLCPRFVVLQFTIIRTQTKETYFQRTTNLMFTPRFTMSCQASLCFRYSTIFIWSWLLFFPGHGMCRQLLACQMEPNLVMGWANSVAPLLTTH